MSERSDRHAVVSRLREEIRRLERRPARRSGVVASGLVDVDAVLPGGGFPRGALSELSGGRASGKTAVALALFASLEPHELAAYVDGRAELYPPAAAERGVDLARLLVVRPAAAAPAAGAPARPLADARAALWAAEALLASGAFAAVAIDVPVGAEIEGRDAVARRLQAAAERGGAVGLWLSAGSGLRVPASVRVEVVRDGERIVARRGLARARAGGHRAA
jgi:protein ImuA